jgi:hypothetical protein
MIQFAGRSIHTIKMPKKPIKQGYKVFALGFEGYLYSFRLHSGKTGIADIFKHSHLTNTGSLVLDLVKDLPTKERRYDLYMDNFFTTLPVITQLRELDVGMCGTTRSGNGFPPLLLKLKNEASNQWAYNSLAAIEKENTLCLAWQDNNVVIALSNLHTPKETVLRVRNQPRQTSTNGALARRAFQGEPQKLIPIPKFIDDYNHNMNGIDVADQLRANYTLQRKARRNWWPYFYWLLDSAIINAYKLSLFARREDLGGEQNESQRSKERASHRNFRVQLYVTLLAQGKVESKPKSIKRSHSEAFEDSDWPRIASLPGKHALAAGLKRNYCWVCKRNAKEKEQRRFGDDITGSATNQSSGFGSQRPTQTFLVCQPCNYALCKLFLLQAIPFSGSSSVEYQPLVSKRIYRVRDRHYGVQLFVN